MLHDDYENVKGQIGPCGINCGECPLGNGSVAGAAIDLRKYLEKYDVPSWAGELPGGKDVDFKRFDKDLVWVTNYLRCPGCLKGGGNPDCPIRFCSRERGHTSCGNCSDLAKCDKFGMFGEREKLIKDQLAKKD